MAPKNQGISGLNIGDTDTLLKALGRPKTFNEIAEQYALGLEGKGALKDKFMPKPGQIQSEIGDTKFISGLKGLGNLGIDGFNAIRGGAGIISAFTNPSGNIISNYAGQESDDSFQKRINQKVIGPGSEMFLPNEDSSFRVGDNVTGAQTMSDVPGMDIFTEAGQQALTDQINSANLGENVPDPRAFNAGDSANADTVNKIKEQIEKENQTDEKNSIVDTSFDSDFDADLADSTGATDGSGENLNSAQTATKSAIADYLSQVRGDQKEVGPTSFDDYIKEFGDATGLDISGDPDNKQALMSFGLALMQNRAGKGFDVSKILTSVGEAGEAAMPDFRKAVSEAKSIRARAGSYALSNAKSDKAKAMNRGSYVIIPKKGGLASSILKNNGEFTRLNSYELNNLIGNEKFDNEYEIIDSSVYTDMTKSLITAQNKGKKKIFLEKPRSIPLFSGSKTTFDVFYANPNNPTGTKSQVISPELAVNAIQTMEKSLTRRVDKFRDIAKLINESPDIDAASQVGSFGKQLAISFGIKIGDGQTTPLKQLNALLIELKARNAAEILGESGKTISDNDRNLVDSIVGSINPLKGDADIKLLKAKLGRLFKQITSSKNDEIEESYSNLSKFGINVDRKNASTVGSLMVRGEDNVFRFKTQGTT